MKSEYVKRKKVVGKQVNAILSDWRPYYYYIEVRVEKKHGQDYSSLTRGSRRHAVLQSIKNS